MPSVGLRSSTKLLGDLIREMKGDLMRRVRQVCGSLRLVLEIAADHGAMEERDRGVGSRRARKALSFVGLGTRVVPRSDLSVLLRPGENLLQGATARQPHSNKSLSLIHI